jgi:hypothetical protein
MRGASSGEWTGDRIDVSIGRGKARILYDDEVEASAVAKGRRKQKQKRRRWWKFGLGG